MKPGTPPVIDELNDLRAALRAAGNITLDWKCGNRRIVMTPAAAAAPPRPPAPGLTVTADGAALFHPGGSPGMAPLAPAGTRVTQGQVLGVLQVGAALLPIHAPADGLIEAILAADGGLVGHGTPLFHLAT